MTPTAIVTGGSSGIGRAVALTFARIGFDVGITYRSGFDRAKAVITEIEALGRRGFARPQDLSGPDAASAVGGLVEDLGHLDAFVNNAGENRRCAFLDETAAEWERSLSANLTGAFLCGQAAARIMVAAGRGGTIVNVTSVLDRDVLEGGAAYCVGKAGLRQLTRVMALELAAYDIRVNGVAPGETATPMNFREPVDAASIRRPVTPMGRPGYADEVASVVCFLATKSSAYVTGEVVLVDGGLALHGGPQALQHAVGRPTPSQGDVTVLER